MVGLAKPGVSMARIREELEAIRDEEQKAHGPFNGPPRLRVEPYADKLTGSARRPLLILLAAVLVSLATGDAIGGSIIVAILILSIGLDTFQEGHAVRSAAALRRSWSWVVASIPISPVAKTSISTPRFSACPRPRLPRNLTPLWLIPASKNSSTNPSTLTPAA